MENDECLSDADLIYVGEEHIDLDDPAIQSAGADGEYLIDQDQEQEGSGYAEVDDVEYGEGVYDDSKNEDDLVDLKEEKEGAGGEVDGLMVVDELDDEDFNSDDESEAPVEKDALNPEEIERAILTMPTMKVLMDDIGHLKKNRSVIVSPLSVEDFNASQIQDLLIWNTLEEVKINYTRNHKDVKTLVGIMVLHFTTSGSAARAVEQLKSWRENLDIKIESNSNKIVEDFVSEARGKKRWTDSIALLRNLADDVKVENIKELFPQVEEVVLHLDTSKRKESSTANKDASSTGPAAVPATTPSSTASSPRGYAYLIFPSDDAMKAEIEEAENKKLELCGHRIFLLHYRNPIQPIPRNYLRLRERKVIMKHMDKCERGIEQAKTDPSVKLPEKVQERVDVCKLLIEKDNKSRKEMELPEPSLEELKKMSGLPTLDSPAYQNILVRFGVIKEKKKKQSNVHNDRDKRRNRSPYKPLYNKGSGRRNSPQRGTRRSPYSNRKRGRGGNYRNSRNMGGRTTQSLLGNATGIVNPLALMMQQNLGMLGGAGVLNPNLLVQPNLAMMGHGANLLGSQGLPYMGGGGAVDDSRGSMLRLDETGNFRPNDHSRQSSRYDDRMRRGGDDGRRKRSRSPMDRGPIGMRSRSGYDVPSSASRTSMDDEVSGPVNLLLNLSQMLSSQKMEQKRQQIDDKRGSYDRDFRGSQR